MKRLLFLMMAALLVLTACGDDDEQAKEDPTVESENQNEVSEEEADEQSEEAVLTDEDVKEIKTSTESGIETDREDGFEYYLDEFKYEDERITARIDIQEDPLATKEEVKDYAENVAWLIGSLIDNDTVGVSVIATTKFDDDEYVIYGTATYNDGDTEFQEEDGMQLLE